MLSLKPTISCFRESSDLESTLTDLSNAGISLVLANTFVLLLLFELPPVIAPEVLRISPSRVTQTKAYLNLLAAFIQLSRSVKITTLPRRLFTIFSNFVSYLTRFAAIPTYPGMVFSCLSVPESIVLPWTADMGRKVARP